MASRKMTVVVLLVVATVIARSASPSSASGDCFGDCYNRCAEGRSGADVSHCPEMCELACTVPEVGLDGSDLSRMILGR